jgi:hypothetical protein
MRWAGYVARMGKDREMYNVLVENQKEREHSEDRRRNGRIESEWTLERLFVGVEWIQSAQDRGRWWGVVYTVINLRFLAPRYYL